MKKMRLFGVCLILLVLVLAVVNVNVSGAAKELVYWHLYSDTDTEKGLTIKDYAKLYEKRTGVKISLSQVRSIDHEQRMTMIGVTKDSSPDLFSCGANLTGFRVNVGGGYVEPLDKYLTKKDLAQYNPNLLEQCRVNGKLYGLPQEAQLYTLIYQTQVFKDLNINEPKTIQDIEAAADKLLAAGIIPIGMLGDRTHGAEWLFQVLATRTLSQHDLDAIAAGKASMSKLSSVLEIMERWAKRGYFGSNIGAQAWAVLTDMHYRGKVGMVFLGCFWPAGTRNVFKVVDVPFQAVVLPALGEGGSKQMAGGLNWGVSVNAYSKNKKDAVKAALHYIGKEFSETWLTRNLNLPGSTVDEFKATFRPLKDYINMADKYSTAWMVFPSSVMSDVRDVMFRLVSGKVTAANTVKELDELIKKGNK